MGLAQEKEIIPEKLNTLEKPIEVGQQVEKKLEEVTETVEKSVEQGTPKEVTPAEVSPLEKPAPQKKTEVPELGALEKTLKNLETELANIISSNDVENLGENANLQRTIDAIVETFRGKEKDIREEDIVAIAERASGGDIGTYGFLLSMLDARAKKSLKTSD